LLPAIALAAACSSTSSQHANSVDTNNGASPTPLRGAVTRVLAQGDSPVTPADARQGPPATALPAYPCEGQGACRCDDFPSRPESQRVYRQHGGANWSGLDPDGDGSICESLP
jgi:hypothetical protein